MLEEYHNFELNQPKYKILIETIFLAIRNKKLKRGDQLPSINKICSELSISRDTVLTAFKELKIKGIISSVSGKGYFLESTRIDNVKRVFLLFDELNSFKDDIYNSFLENLSVEAEVDLYFHHFNLKTFKSLIAESVNKFTSYIIMPAIFGNLSEELKSLPAENTYILDRKKNVIFNKYTTIFQDFENGTLSSLNSGDKLFEKYNKIVMIYPGGKEPVGRKKALVNYCKNKNIKLLIKKDLSSVTINKGEVYFVHSDRNLVKIVKEVKKNRFKLGVDVGVVSFNDTELKEVVANGITTISTDVKEMGRQLALSIMNKTNKNIEIPTKLIIRKSL